MREKKGYLQVYTGDGKGKTTAAIGLAVRAALAGKRVFVGQFVKNMRYHECRIEELLPSIHFEQFGLGCALIHEPSEEDVRHGREGLARAAEVMASGEWDVVVLDEVTIALYFHFFTVEELLKDESGAVVGVRAGEDEITANVVVLAEGCNPILSEKCLGNPRPKASQMAVGIKQVFELPAQTIEDRFLCPEGEGAAMLFVGDCTHGSVGGGFLYTNKESISLGLVATISIAEDGSRNEVPVYQMLEDFKNHPAVAPIIRGGKLVEHSGHMVPEGGYDMVPQYVFDGCLVAGETAGLCMNMGYQVRGMDFAVASGQFAGEAAVAALDAGDTSAAGLAGYKQKMEDSFVMKDLKTFSKWPHVMEEWDSMFNDYPTMVAEIFNAMFSVDGEPQQPLMKRMMPIIKQRGLLKLGGEVRKAVKAL